MSRQQAREFAGMRTDVKHHKDGRLKVVRQPRQEPFKSSQTPGRRADTHRSRDGRDYRWPRGLHNLEGNRTGHIGSTHKTAIWSTPVWHQSSFPLLAKGRTIGVERRAGPNQPAEHKHAPAARRTYKQAAPALMFHSG